MIDKELATTAAMAADSRMRLRMIVLHVDRLHGETPRSEASTGPRPSTHADTERTLEWFQIALDLFELLLPQRANGSKMAAMRRIIVTGCICWLAWCGAPGANNLPLAFGMTPPEAELALGVPLLYHSGGRGSELYVAS